MLTDSIRPRILSDADITARDLDETQTKAQIAPAAGPRRKQILSNGAEVEDEDLEDVRLAIVMAGGISLCIWMGGVTLELDRARRRKSIYDEILTLTRSTIRIDVISGASAGGINGTLLGAAIAHQATLSGLRQTWFDKADFEKLLRHPFEPDPPSLLKGDEFFLPEIAKVLQAFSENKARDASAPPSVEDIARNVAPELKVIATTTLIRGAGRVFFDDFGQLIPDVTHRGEFAFTGESMVEDDAHLRLAVAARSSAAHPGGFEASFAPVGEDIPAKGEVPQRPRMDRLTNWHSSRYTLDGGILVNRPLRPAVREIFRQPADREVRRAVAFVVPDPPTSYEEVGDDIEAQPNALETWLATVNVSLKQTIGEELDALTEHNRHVEVQRMLRCRLFDSSENDIVDLAEKLYESHQAVRRCQWTHRILDALKFPSPLLLRRDDDGWKKEAIKDSIDAAAGVARPEQPFPSVDTAATSLHHRWDPDTVEGMILIVLDLATVAIKIAPATDDDRSAGTRRGLRWARGRANAMLRAARAFREEEVHHWSEGSRAASGGSAVGWAASLEGSAASTDETLARLVGDAADLFIQVRHFGAAAASAAERADFTDPNQEAAIAFLKAAAVTAPGDEGSAEHAAAVRSSARFLLALEVVQASLLGYDEVPDQKIDFMQISANVPNPFDPRATPAEKLTGLQLAHFGAFYKRSWKANDFMWGRLDGSYRLVQMLLSPHRLQRVAATIDPQDRVKQVADAIERIALGTETAEPDVHQYLNQDKLIWRPDIEAELAFLTNGDAPPPSLTRATEWIARRAQLEAVMEEIPHVVASLKVDQADLGNISREARDLILQHDSLACPQEELDWESESKVPPWAKQLWAWMTQKKSRTPTPLRPKDAVGLFTRCDIGKELLVDEFGTDKMTRITTTALAVGVKMLGGARGGLGPVQAVFASVRALALGIYVLARAALNSSKTVSALIVTVVVIAAAALVMHYDGAVDLGGLPFKIAWLTLVSAVVVALLRGGARWSVLAIVLAIALTLWAASRITDESIRRLTLVGGATLGALIVTTILGSGFGRLRRLRVVGGMFLVAAITAAMFSLVFLPISIGLPDANLQCDPPLGRTVDEFMPITKEALTEDQKKANKKAARAACDDLRDDWIVRFALTLTVTALVAGLMWSKRKQRRDPAPRPRATPPDTSPAR